MGADSILTSIFLGILATGSPCVLPLYPGFLAYLSGGQQALAGSKGRYLLGFFVLAGVLVMMLALGGLIALLSVSIGSALSIAIPLADVLIVALGVMLIFDRNPFKRLPQIQVPVLSHPYVNAFLYGLLYGPIALPCSGPLVVGHLRPVIYCGRGDWQAGCVSVVWIRVRFAAAAALVFGRRFSALDHTPVCDTQPGNKLNWRLPVGGHWHIRFHLQLGSDRVDARIISLIEIIYIRVSVCISD
jgi:hypothetical protein